MAAKKNINYNIVLLHTIGCIAFLSIPIFSGHHWPQRGLFDRMYVDEIMEYAFTIVFFYLNYYFLIPRLYLRRKYTLFVLAAIIGFIVVSLLPELLTSNFHKLPPPPFECPPGTFGPPMPPNIDRRNDSLLKYLWMELGPFDDNFPKYAAVFILAITLRITEQLKKIQKQKAESELMFLKAQINPHFLFNTLNSVYTLAIEAKANNVAKAIAQLSAMMRYATSEASTQFVALSKEIAYIDNYITLQRLRLNERVKLSYSVKGEATGNSIAPFLLIPFIENAFKYGVSTDEDTSISVQIILQGNAVIMHVINDKAKISGNIEKGTSIGIGNTRKRLDLLYPGKYDLKIIDEDTQFNVLITIEL